MGLLFFSQKPNKMLFFSQKPNKTFCLVSVKKTQHGKNGFGFAVYGLLCMGLLWVAWVCYRKERQR
jgi:hypothetical protein